ncbi:hypothetical protein chiPu_0025991 [Chiloscyllium punctatum]|uniref:Uncharacterized protein n=1 Tax=Chiloscyllium punctatum TaxID=137246 RepID=A0A401THJ5_CHIPU|nr:hypothetical protein [Chiloscyllium punctatum]
MARPLPHEKTSRGGCWRGKRRRRRITLSAPQTMLRLKGNQDGCRTARSLLATGRPPPHHPTPHRENGGVARRGRDGSTSVNLDLFRGQELAKMAATPHSPCVSDVKLPTCPHPPQPPEKTMGVQEEEEPTDWLRCPLTRVEGNGRLRWPPAVRSLCALPQAPSSVVRHRDKPFGPSPSMPAQTS